MEAIVNENEFNPKMVPLYKVLEIIEKYRVNGAKLSNDCIDEIKSIEEEISQDDLRKMYLGNNPYNF